MTKTVKLLGPAKIDFKWYGENDDVEVDAETLAQLVGLGLVLIEPAENVELVLVQPEPGNAIQENVRAELESQLKAATARADQLAEARKALQDEAVKRDALIDELISARDEARERGAVLAKEVEDLKAQIAASTAPPPAPKAKTTKA